MKDKKPKYHPIFQKIAVFCVGVGYHFFFGYRVVGRKNIPKGACIVCPNHTQYSDPPFAVIVQHRRYEYALMAKKELFDGGFFSSLITWLGAFPIDREHADIEGIKTALRSLRDGKKLIMFPQGTRGDKTTEAKEGAAMLAVKTHTPILPMYIPPNKKFRSHVTVIIGKPYYVEGTKKDYPVIADEIIQKIYELAPEDERP